MGLAPLPPGKENEPLLLTLTCLMGADGAAATELTICTTSGATLASVLVIAGLKLGVPPSELSVYRLDRSARGKETGPPAPSLIPLTAFRHPLDTLCILDGQRLLLEHTPAAAAAAGTSAAKVAALAPSRVLAEFARVQNQVTLTLGHRCLAVMPSGGWPLQSLTFEISTTMAALKRAIIAAFDVFLTEGDVRWGFFLCLFVRLLFPHVFPPHL